MENASKTIQVEVAYATPCRQIILPVQLESGASIRDAITLSGILDKFPEIDMEVNKAGIFSKRKPLDEGLRDRDRVEIYRALIADPKVVRKQRAAQGKDMRKGT